MAAPKGNKNAEKWNIKESQRFFEQVLEYIQKNEECSSMSEACSALGWYEDIFCYIQNKHKSIDFKPIKKGMEILKHRIIKKGLTNKYNPTMSIFILKNNHGMEDKQVQDQNVKTLDIPPIKFVKTDDRDK